MPSIVLCEDDAFLRDVEAEVLTSIAGHQVDTFPSGEALIDALPSLRPSLIILDVRLPAMSGIHAYQRIRSIDDYQEVPILFYTSQPEHVHAAELAGNYAVAAKPMDIDSLLLVVGMLLRQAPTSQN
jgi:DNA-binding response OmpR family regulator